MVLQVPKCSGFGTAGEVQEAAVIFPYSALNESSKHIKLPSEDLTRVNEKASGTLLFLFWEWCIVHTGLCCVSQLLHWEQ